MYLHSRLWCFLPVLGFTAPCIAQDSFSLALGNEVQTVAAAVESQETLGAWQKTHPGETPQHADYQADENWPDSDFRDLHSRCAFSVAYPATDITRTAFFVAPLVTAAKLPPLPAGEGEALIRSCRLEEAWVEARDPVSLDSLVRILASAWGNPNGFSQSFRDAIVSPRLGKDSVAWHRAAMNIWVVTDRQAPAQVRAVYARNDIVPAEKDWYDSVGGLEQKVRQQSVATLARIAALDPALTQEVLARTTCSSELRATPEPSAMTAGRLEHWLGELKNLAPPRRAAALLLADYYVPCIEWPLSDLTAETTRRYASMGVEFGYGYQYIHAFRDQAEKLDRRGVAGAWAALDEFWDECRIGYGAVLNTGEGLARRFPEWRPYIHYGLARAHAARISFTDPGGPAEPPDIFAPIDLGARGIERERSAAIRDFRSFISEKPFDPEAVFAWQEVWRLRAGLKRTRVSFGCSGE